MMGFAALNPSYALLLPALLFASRLTPAVKIVAASAFIRFSPVYLHIFFILAWQ
jgi:hypothetical protein